MKKYSFKKPKFIISGVKAKDFPILRDLSGEILPEIAIAGRSNVGKSSLINHLFQSKGLAKTSATPGKTQILNFFTADDSFAFVDLPGYGFAQVPLNIRRNWGKMIQGYLSNRSSLKLILLLVDIRRVPSEEDLSMFDWIIQNNKSMILVLTKVDKVSNNEKVKNMKKILQTLNAENIQYVYYSSTHNIGRNQLMGMIKEALDSETQNQEYNEENC